MLSKTHKNTPIRLAAGLAGVSALSLAALGLTASGTQAAEQIKAKVEAVTGVSLGQDVPAPPAPPAAPEAPAAPDAPKLERHVYRYTEDGKGKDGKQVKKIVIVHADGTTDEHPMPDMSRIMADMPEVRTFDCGPGKKDEPAVEHKQEGKKQIMVICSDRMAKISIDAQRMAMDSKRFGMRSAMMGLQMARRSVENEHDISDEDRAEALKGIDEAIREIQKQDMGDKDDN